MILFLSIVYFKFNDFKTLFNAISLLLFGNEPVNKARSSKSLYLKFKWKGYLGMHIVYLLLKDGHSVRAAVKSLADEDEVNSIKKLEQKYTNQLELIEADILSPDSWVKAVDGINIVFHVASVTTELNITEEEHIQPAIEGTMNVLKVVYLFC